MKAKFPSGLPFNTIGSCGNNPIERSIDDINDPASTLTLTGLFILRRSALRPRPIVARCVIHSPDLSKCRPCENINPSCTSAALIAKEPKLLPSAVVVTSTVAFFVTARRAPSGLRLGGEEKGPLSDEIVV